MPNIMGNITGEKSLSMTIEHVPVAYGSPWRKYPSTHPLFSPSPAAFEALAQKLVAGT